VGKAQVQNLVIVLLQSLHFHARDGVVEPLELIVPGDSTCSTEALPRTWVPRHIPGHAVVAVEKLLPQEFVASHGAPLLADEPHREHVGVVQVQKDLEQDGVREPGTARVHRVILPPRLEPSGSCLAQLLFCFNKSAGPSRRGVCRAGRPHSGTQGRECARGAARGKPAVLKT
uniref:Uncharacterized protein n=1 Tax=Cyanistes caeruleus TaxID=156563 RepID=A0A8C0ZJX2_CYACU